MPHPRRIAALFDQPEILAGVARFCRQQPAWHVYRLNTDAGAALARLGTQQVDGVIASSKVRLGDVPRSLRPPAVPWVSVLGEADPQGEPIPRVRVDDREVGRLAARAFLGLGLRRFGYVHEPLARVAVPRHEGFREVLAEAGFDASALELPHAGNPSHYEAVIRVLCRWLAAAPKPIGVLAFDDTWATAVAEACDLVSIPVPESVAIIGINNDELTCVGCRPSLSSIDPNFQALGYAAAAMVRQLIDGVAPERTDVVIRPRGLVERESTNVMAFADRDVARALNFIRRHYPDPISVEDIAAHVHLSKRTLERRFAAAVGHSPASELWRVRAQRAQQLLVETDLPLMQIAVDTGFCSVSHLCRLIKRATGRTPTQCRRELR